MEKIVADRNNKARNGGTLGPKRRRTNDLLSRRLLFVLPLRRDNNNGDVVSGGDNVIQWPHKRARVDDKENVSNGSGGDVDNNNSITAALTDTNCTTPTTHRYDATIQACIRRSIVRHQLASKTDDMEEDDEDDESNASTAKQKQRVVIHEEKEEEDSENEFEWNDYDDEQHDKVCFAGYNHVSDLFRHLHASSQLRVIIPRWWMVLQE
jgi:hypothetical protein